MSPLLSNKNILVCNSNSAKEIKKLIHLTTLFLREVSFFTETYILDYFVDEVWTKLPSSWYEVIQNFDVSDLENFLNSEESIRSKSPLPLSLLALRTCAFNLAVHRKSIKSLEVIQNFLHENFTLRNDFDYLNSSCKENYWNCLSEEFDKKSGQHKKVPEFCRRHVKPKKQHEIFRLGNVTDSVLTYFNLKRIIDIGSGLGHLSRLLSLSYNFQVATVEANQCHVSGALTFDKQAYNSWKREQNQESAQLDFEKLPHHLKESLTLITSEKSLKELINGAWCNEIFSKERIGLIGLHTCGNLAETLLKTFCKCDELQVLISVGCCYMKSDTGSEGESYPLSSFVKSLSDHTLSYEAKELACHALEMYMKKLKENASSLKIHCYRATLEKCIVNNYPDQKHLGLRGVKHAELLDFSDYAEQALRKVSLKIPKECFSLPEIQSCLNRWKEVLVFYSLRLIVAPVIETLILMDRLLYLHEKGHPSCLATIFDPSISPRNHVLISAKCDYEI